MLTSPTWGSLRRPWSPHSVENYVCETQRTQSLGVGLETVAPVLQGGVCNAQFPPSGRVVSSRET